MTIPLPFDREIAHALATRREIVTTLRPDQIGELRARSVRPTDHEITLGGQFELTIHDVPHREHDDLRIVLLRHRTTSRPAPVIYHVHGGGLVVGSALDDLPALAALVSDTDWAVAAVEYRLAPEHPYPAAIDDVYSGLVWIRDNTAALGLDSDRIVIEGGSAGAGLAAAAALMARDRGAPQLFGQMLLGPMLDDRNDSHSAHQMIGRGAWDRSANETGWAAYLGADRDDVPIYASPGRATELAGLPQTFIDVGSAETFRDEAVAYASRIWDSGGAAELHVWAGGAHGFDGLAPDAAISCHAREARVHWLERLLASSLD